MPLDDTNPEYISRIFSSLGSLLGSSVFLAFMKPKSVKEGFLRLGLSLLTSFLCTKALILILVLNQSYEVYLAVGFLTGLFSWTIFSILGTTALNVESKKIDIFDIIKKIRNKDS